jgi:hypothetical protein
MSRTRFYERFKQFKHGWQSVHDELRLGRPSASCDDAHIVQVCEIVRSNCCLTVWEIAEECNILYNVGGYLISSDHQLYCVTSLKTPFGLVIPLLQPQSHVTAITHNYFLRCYTCTQLTITHS